MAQSQSQTCVVCGTELTVHECVRGNVCADAECRRASVRRQLQARREAREQTLRAAARWRRQFPGPPSALDTDAGAPGADTVLLPVNTRPLGPLPERRRRRFRDYFT
ncbi:MAG: hypothetical protein GVY09_03955, partial [Gammaproteobacteria bacterium]|nr:hypothetical protein [Gammaproteobacteria bacterium]